MYKPNKWHAQFRRWHGGVRKSGVRVSTLPALAEVRPARRAAATAAADGTAAAAAGGDDAGAASAGVPTPVDEAGDRRRPNLVAGCR